MQPGSDLEAKIYPRGREWPEEVRGLPPMDQRLIQHLEALYPDRCPNPGMHIEEEALASWLQGTEADIDCLALGWRAPKTLGPVHGGVRPLSVG